MRVVRGRDTVEVSEAEVAAMLRGYDRVVIDVGAGDGRFAYGYAREHPEVFVLGMEPVKENVRESSRKAGRTPQRGGRANVAYVWARAERPPSELAGRGDEIHVTLPWGRLLDGLVLGDPDVLGGLAFLAVPGASVHATLNCGILEQGPNVPVRTAHLPELTPHYVWQNLAGRYAAAGLPLTHARMLSPDEVRALRSPWAKRLRSGRQPPGFLYLRALACGPP